MTATKRVHRECDLWKVLSQTILNQTRYRGYQLSVDYRFSFKPSHTFSPGECYNLGPEQQSLGPHHILLYYVFTDQHQFGSLSVWTLCFPAHKYLWTWQVWEARSQELPTGPRKLEKHTHPGVMIASNPRPCPGNYVPKPCMPFLSLWQIFPKWRPETARAPWEDFQRVLRE